MTKPRCKLPLFSKERAQTMVEFALVFPVVLLITYGIIEFGRMVFIYASVTSAAREGARFGAASGIDGNGIIQFADCQAIKDAVRRTAILITIPDNQINISYDDGSNSKGLCPPSMDFHDPNYIRLGDRIIVIVTAHYEPIMGRFLGISGFDLTKSNYRTILTDVPLPYP
jgi:hypothetical protein